MNDDTAIDRQWHKVSEMEQRKETFCCMLDMIELVSLWVGGTIGS